MNTKRLIKLIVVPAITLTVLGVLLVFRISFAAKNDNQASTGMGELRRFEAQQSLPIVRDQRSRHSYAGMGDLRRFEAQQSLPVVIGQGSRHSYVGMGDLRRFEAQQESQKPSEGSS